MRLLLHAPQKNQHWRSSILLLTVWGIFSMVNLSSTISSTYRYFTDFGEDWTVEPISALSMKNWSLLPTLSNREETKYDDDFYIDKIREVPIPNPPLVEGSTSFSACLLIMDDNHRLVEWLAYHYFVLPLRYLIVAVDPRSRTSPTLVLNRWRRMGMYILEWGDTEIFGTDKVLQLEDTATVEDKTAQFLTRQKAFYGACIRQARADQRSWVTLHDTDEFVVYSQKGGKYYEEWQKEAEQQHPRVKPKHVPPTTAEEGALIKYIGQEAAAGQAYFNQTCFAVARLLFGGIDDDPENTQHLLEEEDKSILQGVIDPDRLDTIRYNRHAGRTDRGANGLGKAIMDVSRIDVESYSVTGVHRPIVQHCPNAFTPYWESLITINHYVGSWEAYSFRDDSRRGGIRNYHHWLGKVEGIRNETDNTISPWIGGFVRSVGAEKARELLQCAGLPRGYKNGLTAEWGNSSVAWNEQQGSRNDKR